MYFLLTSPTLKVSRSSFKSSSLVLYLASYVVLKKLHRNAEIVSRAVYRTHQDIFTCMLTISFSNTLSSLCVVRYMCPISHVQKPRLAGLECEIAHFPVVTSQHANRLIPTKFTCKSDKKGQLLNELHRRNVGMRVHAPLQRGALELHSCFL